MTSRFNSSLMASPALFPLVGREVERSRLHKALEQAASGLGSMALLAGEPGIGKSRLAAEVALEASGRGFRVLSGRIGEFETLPYLPFVEIIEDAAAADPSTFRRALGDAAPEVAKIAPGLRRRFADISAPLELPAEHERHLLFASFREFIGRMALERPLMLVVEDLHWADQATLLMLLDLAEHVAGHNVLLLGTCRDNELDNARPFADAFEELLRRRLARLVTLKRFESREVQTMLRALAGSEPSGQLTEAFLKLTDGNPFFIEEMFRHMADQRRLVEAQGQLQGDFNLDESDVPRTLRMTIARRLQRLTPLALTVLKAAAVIGRDFDLAILRSVIGRDPDEVGDALAEGARAHLIDATQRKLGPGFRFVHELVRQTLLVAIPIHRRQHLHSLIAQALEEAHGFSDESAPELAYHYSHADSVAEPGHAIPYLSAAGQKALKAAAFEDAARWFGKALALGPENPATVADIRLALGLSQRGLGAWQDALNSWSLALDICGKLGRVDELAELCALITQQLSSTMAPAGAKPLIERTLILLKGHATAPHCRLLASSAVIESFAGKYRAAQERLAQARAIYENLGDEKLTGDIATAECAHHYAWMQHQQAVAAAGPGITQMRRGGDLWGLCNLLLYKLLSVQCLGRFAEAKEIARELLPLATRLGHLPAKLFALRFEAIAGLATSCDYTTAIDFCKEDVPRSEAVSPGFAAMAQSMWGMAEFWHGNWDAALEHFRAADAWWLRGELAFGGGELCIPLVKASAGDTAEAFAMLEQVRDRLPRLGEPASMASWLTLLGTAEVLAAGAETTRLAELYPLLLEAIAGGLLFSGFSMRLVQTLAGCSAAAAKKWAAAEGHFREALLLAHKLPLRFEQPETRRFYARMLIERDWPGDRAMARTLLEEAIEHYRQIGAPRHQALAQALMNAAATEKAAFSSAAEDGHCTEASSSGLFRREGEYWTVRYQGVPLQLRDARGIRYLAHLIQHPGEKFHVSELTNLAYGLGTARLVQSDAGPVLDSRSRAEYKQRLSEMRTEADEAEKNNDLLRAQSARREIAALSAELSAALGLGGRQRTTGSTVERARTATTMAVRTAIKRIAKEHPALGRHLTATVRTGYFCSYAPAADHPVVWRA